MENNLQWLKMTYFSPSRVELSSKNSSYVFNLRAQDQHWDFMTLPDTVETTSLTVIVLETESLVNVFAGFTEVHLFGCHLQQQQQGREELWPTILFNEFQERSV